MNDPVVVASFRYRYEAELARGILDDDGIPSMLMADDVGGSYAGLSLSSGARVSVRAADRERARAVLEEAGVVERS